MFTRCIFCHAPFPANQSLEHLRHGRRVAFDPARGRLWTVCGACARWTLAPIEERWEALEELDRLATDRARLLSRTDNIEMLRADSEGLELVRVGRAQRTEEAWWRYGRELMGRRKRSYVLQGVEVAAMLGVALASGGVAAGWYGTGMLSAAARWYRFGRVALPGRLECPRCGASREGLKFDDTRRLVLEPGDGPGELTLHVPCSWCPKHTDPVSGHRVTGVAAEHALRRILAYRHFSGASEGRIRAATMAIDHAGSPEALAGEVAGQRISLHRLEKDRRTHAVALEIAVNDETERRLLEMELAELERRWKEEEEIAAIVDRELTFLPGLDRLLGRLRGASEGPPSTP